MTDQNLTKAGGDESLSAVGAFCMDCGVPIEAGAIRCTNCPRCPYCLETIRPGAAKCKHCGEFLVSQRLPPQLPAKDGAAAVMSFFVPGLGQMYHGKIGVGLLWLVAVAVGYVLMIVPGVILHVICISSAYSEHKI
jgi:hypothetical protein